MPEPNMSHCEIHNQCVRRSVKEEDGCPVVGFFARQHSPLSQYHPVLCHVQVFSGFLLQQIKKIEDQGKYVTFASMMHKEAGES
jgi:hypothetical protein